MDIQKIIDFYSSSPTEVLAKKADEVCQQYYGNSVFLRGLIEFSNYCSMDCLYCGIRKSNHKAVRYRMEKEEILATVRQGLSHSLKTFVLQSGEDHYYTLDLLCEIIQAIKKMDETIALTLSCGIRPRKEYEQLKNVGADRYLMRFETSDPHLHTRIRNGFPFEKRLEALYCLKECGYEVGSGYMVGLPDETEEMRIQNAILCRKLGLDMVGIGPYIPHPDTPLFVFGKGGGTIEMTTRAVALTRLLLPKANIPATTAAGTVHTEGREKILQAGANVLMPNITPVTYKKNYLLYPDKICLDEDGAKCMGCLDLRVQSVGKKISWERGDSISWKERQCQTM